MSVSDICIYKILFVLNFKLSIILNSVVCPYNIIKYIFFQKNIN